MGLIHNCDIESHIIFTEYTELVVLENIYKPKFYLLRSIAVISEPN